MYTHSGISDMLSTHVPVSHRHRIYICQHPPTHSHPPSSSIHSPSFSRTGLTTAPLNVRLEKKGSSRSAPSSAAPSHPPPAAAAAPAATAGPLNNGETCGHTRARYRLSKPTFSEEGSVESSSLQVGRKKEEEEISQSISQINQSVNQSIFIL